jgi:hypothetical protein
MRATCRWAVRDKACQAQPSIELPRRRLGCSDQLRRPSLELNFASYSALHEVRDSKFISLPPPRFYLCHARARHILHRCSLMSSRRPPGHVIPTSTFSTPTGLGQVEVPDPFRALQFPLGGPTYPPLATCPVLRLHLHAVLGSCRRRRREIQTTRSGPTSDMLDNYHVASSLMFCRHLTAFDPVTLATTSRYAGILIRYNIGALGP